MNYRDGILEEIGIDVDKLSYAGKRALLEHRATLMRFTAFLGCLAMGKLRKAVALHSELRL